MGSLYADLFHKVPTVCLGAQESQQFIIARLLVPAATVTDPALNYKSRLQTPCEGLGPSHAGLHVAWISRLISFIFWPLLHTHEAENFSSLLPGTEGRAAWVRYVTPPLSSSLVSGWLSKSSPFRDPIGRHPTSCFIYTAARALLCMRLATSGVTGKQCVAWNHQHSSILDSIEPDSWVIEKGQELVVNACLPSE